MTMYKGSNQLSSLNVGGTEIGQVYKGNELIWQKADDTEITLYEYRATSNNRYAVFFFENININAYIFSKRYSWASGTTANATITDIIGNLGTINSQVCFEGSNIYFDYCKTLIINNKTVFLYTTNAVTSGRTHFELVLENSNSTINTVAAGGMCLTTDLSIDETPLHPISINNNVTFDYLGTSYIANLNNLYATYYWTNHSWNVIKA